MTHPAKLPVAALVTSLLIATGVSTSSAAPARTSEAALREARATASLLSAKADAIRADLESGSFDRAISRLATMAGLTARASDPAPATVTAPAGFAAPVAELLGAVTDAAVGVERAVASDGGRSERLSARADRLGTQVALALSRGDRLPVARVRALRAEVLGGAVLRAAADGGRTIGAALDRTLPRLRAAAASLPSSGAPAAACDVVDQRPALCINGTGANAIDAEAVLVIDLGGDDIYTSSAGSASSARCVDDEDDHSCRASVLVDLGGDDTYLVHHAVQASHMVGAGSAMSGVGVLVDVDGDDRYVADLSEVKDPLDLSFSFGSAQNGLGLLADLSGNDTYELTGDPDDIRMNQYYFGASLTGMGGLVDGGGTNAYRAVLRGFQEPYLGENSAPSQIIDAMGTGIFGGAALADRTGDATFDIRYEVEAGPRDHIQGTGAIAYGTGLIGDAALLAGPGPTTYSVLTQRVTTATLPGQTEDPGTDEEGNPIPAARLPGASSITAHAVGAVGTGILDDRGGDDVYRAVTRGVHRLEVVAEPGCGCDRAIATMDVDAFDGTLAYAGLSAQAIGSSIFVPDAGALLNDHGGDDTYVARAEQVMTAKATNRLPAPSRGARAEAFPGRFPEVSLFGQGMGSDGSPTVLLDRDGHDRYELVASSTADASARGGGGPESAHSVSGTAQAIGQGASYFDPAQGTLMDLAGSDEYRAHAISRATADPEPGAWGATRDIVAQGAVGGLLADLDEGLVDRFEATPETGPGVGVRGEGPGWTDVSRTFPGFGIAPLQPARRDVALTLAGDNPRSADGGWVPVRARLTEGGAPVAGREVTFAIEYEYPGLLGDTWTTHRMRAHGITDADGWAVGYVDAGEFRDYYFGDTSDMTLRIAARFHGDTGLRTALAAQPLTIEPRDPE